MGFNWKRQLVGKQNLLFDLVSLLPCFMEKLTGERSYSGAWLVGQRLYHRQS